MSIMSRKGAARLSFRRTLKNYYFGKTLLTCFISTSNNLVKYYFLSIASKKGAVLCFSRRAKAATLGNSY